MSSSLEQSEANVESESDSSKLREMLENCDGEEERERIQRRIKSIGESSSVEIVEERRSSSTQLTHQSSTASESGANQQGLVLSPSGGTISASSTSTDVTGELMPLILGQLQSSLDSISASASISSVVGGGGAGAGASAASSSHNIVGSQFHQLSHSSSHNSSSHISNNSNKSLGNSNKSSSDGGDNATTVGNASSALGGGDSTCEASAHRNNNSVVSDSGLQQREEDSSTGGSSEECLFDSGTESGEDLSAHRSSISSGGSASGTGDAAQPSILLSSSALLPTTTSASLASVADAQLPSQYDNALGEFSCFIEGLKNSLKRNTNKESSLNPYCNKNVPTSQDPTGSVGGGDFTGVPLNTSINTQNFPSSQSFPGFSGESSSNSNSATVNLPTAGCSGEIQRLPDGGSVEEQTGSILSSSLDQVRNDSGLVQQVDKVLTLLRNSLVKDPNCLGKISASTDISSACDPSKGKELIALIDRLKSSLSAENPQRDHQENSFSVNPPEARQVSNANSHKVPTSVGLENTGQSSMLGWAQPRPPDIVPFPVARSSSNPWVSDFATASSITPTEQTSQVMVEHNNFGAFNGSGGGETVNKVNQTGASDGGVPWKIRLAKRRSQPRSHTVGVTQEELAEARRLFEESTGFRLENREPKQDHHGQSVYSHMQDLSSTGNNQDSAISSSNSNNYASNTNLHNINNYSQSGSAAVVGTVPAYANVTSSSLGKHDDNMPTSIAFPRDATHQGVMMSSGGSETQGEMMPSGNCISAPHWQKDVEKRLTSIPRPFVPFVKKATQFYEGYQPPPERRMTYASIDDSCPVLGGVVGNLKIKPFRTYSLDNNQNAAQDDPSKSFFTPQESVQIAIHQAAIKKQMSEEEDRRKRKNSLTSYPAYGVKERDYTIGMPKPYSPPHAKNQQKQDEQQKIEQYVNNTDEQQQYEIPSSPGNQTAQPNGFSSSLFQSLDSGFTEESGTESQQKDDQSGLSYESSPVNAPVTAATAVVSANSGTTSMVSINGTNATGRLNDQPNSGNTITYTATPNGGLLQQQQQSPQRIENVQISLKELTSSEFPQLQIAITLNTNNGPSSDSGQGAGGGQITYTAVPTVTTTASSTSVTTNLQLGNAVTSNSGGPSRPLVQKEMSGESNAYFSNDEGQQTPASVSRAIRYKSKNERKKRMKRANTIDIPHPPGLVLHSNNDDDDSEIEDEEDSDTNNYRITKSGSGSGNSSNINQSNKGPPFMPRTDGDRKFLAFLEKNNALSDGRARPAYLGVNDRQWSSRFSNLKTSFDTSSQGSSPSASPIPSPLRGPRSVSEMALTHGKQSGVGGGGESFSKPVWANTDKSQLPPQVRNKLHVFENKSSESQQPSSDLPSWRSPPPVVMSGKSNHFGSRMVMMPGMKQTVSTNALNQVRNDQPTRMSYRPVYSSHDNVATGQKKIHFQGNSFESKLREQQQQQMSQVRKPMPVKPQVIQTMAQDQQPPSMKMPQQQIMQVTDGGVHMVHATAAAIEAMKKSAFVPSSFVPVQSQQPPTMAAFPTGKVGQSQQQEDKIDLPWAKKGPESPTSSNVRDPNAGRIQISRARFEQPPITQLPPTTVSPVNSTIANSQHQQNYQQPKEPKHSPVKYQSDISPNSTAFMAGPPLPNKPNISPTQQQQKLVTYNQMGGSAEEFVPVVRPTLRTFGVTQSFDEAFKRKLEQQVTSGSIINLDDSSKSQDQIPASYETKPEYASTSPNYAASYPQNYDSNIGQQQSFSGTNDSINSTKKSYEFQQSSGSAFAARRSSINDDNDNVMAAQAGVSDANSDNSNAGKVGDDGMILTPVVAKVMRGPQQQRATMTNRVSSLNDEQQNSRLTSARSNLFNILNKCQASSSPALDAASKQEVSPPFAKPPGNLLSLPPLMKSLSGDAITNSSQKPALPTTHFLSQEEIRGFQQTSLQQPLEHEQTRPVLIPRQKSLSDFPKIANPPKIEPLTVETDVNAVNNRNQPNPVQQAIVPQQQKPAFAQPQQQQRPVPQQRSVPHHEQQQHSRAQIPQQPHPQQRTMSHYEQQQQQSRTQIPQQYQQQVPTTTGKPTRSYPDSLQRTSSGTSIFSRAKNLFFGSQDSAPPSTKLRPKLPTQQKQLTFPKQFEAQMSPDSAEKKQRELAAYFKQQQQEQQQQESLLLQGSGKYGVESKAKKSAEAVSKSETSSSSKSVDCEQNEMKASSSLISSSSSVSSSSASSTLTSSSVSTATKIQTVSSSQTMSKSSIPVPPMNKFKAMDLQANQGKKTGAPLFKFANDGLKASASSAKDMLLYWCQCRTRDYENVKIENFSSSWSDGLAFCALIHHFYPDAFDYNSLNPRNRKYNFDLAFRTADEKAGIYPLLESEDMVAMGTRPDWKCVFTYVQSMYHKLKDM